MPHFLIQVGDFLSYRANVVKMKKFQFLVWYISGSIKPIWWAKQKLFSLVIGYYFYLQGVERITQVAQALGAVQKKHIADFQPQDYVSEFKFGLVEVVYEWARGMVRVAHLFYGCKFIMLNVKLWMIVLSKTDGTHFLRILLHIMCWELYKLSSSCFFTSEWAIESILK